MATDQLTFVPLPRHRKRFIDETNKSYGLLTVLGYAGKCQWHCKCKCGNVSKHGASDLRAGRIQSCGCKRGFRHGHAAKGKFSTEYYSWFSMKQRCNTQGSSGYNRYGGRGISVCERWNGKRGFVNFLADMGTKPIGGYSLDRIDNNGNYEPGNCRWASKGQQNRNKSDTHNITYQGVTLCLKDWSTRLGITEAVIRTRLRHNWSIERTLAEKVVRGKHCS